MNDDYDIDFLTEHRPRPDRPSQTDTDFARASLLAHGRQRQRRRRVVAGIQVSALVAAVAAVVVAIGASAGHGHGHGSAPATPPIQAAQAPRAPRTHHAAPTPLTKLAAHVRVLPGPTQPGDATLVRRDTLYNGLPRAGYGGYDLYVDSGQYYYSPDSLSGLQQAVDANANEDAPGEDNEAQIEAKLAAVAGGTPAQARAAALATSSGGWSGPLPSRASQHREWAAQPKLLRDKHPFHPYTARTWRIAQDSDIFIVADQALQAGDGRPDVRAAALKALSTLQDVVETPTTVHGVAALRVDYIAFPREPGEILWLNAATGVPIQENDGGGSTTAYTIERVTAAHLPATISPDVQSR